MNYVVNKYISIYFKKKRILILHHGSVGSILQAVEPLSCVHRKLSAACGGKCDISWCRPLSPSHALPLGFWAILASLLSVCSLADTIRTPVNRLSLAMRDDHSWVREPVRVGGGLLKLMKGCISTHILTLGLIIIDQNLSSCWRWSAVPSTHSWRKCMVLRA